MSATELLSLHPVLYSKCYILNVIYFQKLFLNYGKKDDQVSAGGILELSILILN